MADLSKLFQKWNKKLVQHDEQGYWKLRIWHRRAQEKKSPRLLIKCGCCDNKFEIYYDGDDLEIAGVLASKREWRRLLEPLLNEFTPESRAN